MRRGIGNRWLIVVTLVSLLAWWVLFRYWIMQGDDWRFNAVARHPYGRYSFDQWYYLLQHDYFDRTGRMSDSVARALMRPGPWFFPLAAPVIIAWLGVGIAQWLERRDRHPVAVPVLAVCLLPIALVLRPWLNGDSIFWATSFANYALPLAGYLSVAVVLLRHISGVRSSKVMLIAAVPLAYIIPTLHENMSFGAIMLGIALIVVAWRRLGWYGWLLVVAGFLGAATMLLAPGFRVRFSESNGAVPSGESGMLLRFHRITSGVMTAMQISQVPLALLAIVLAGELWRRSRQLSGRPRMGFRWLAMSAVASMALLIVMRPIWAAAIRPLDGFKKMITPGAIAVGVVGLAAGFIAFCSVLLAAWLLRSETPGELHGQRVFLSVVAFLGCGLPAVMSGVSTPRAYFPLALWALIAAAAALIDAGHLRHRIAAAVVSSLVVAITAGWWGYSLVAMRANYEQWRPVLAQLEHRTSEPRTIEIPMTLKHSNYQFNHGFDLRVYKRFITTYFALPTSTQLKQVPR